MKISAVLATALVHLALIGGLLQPQIKRVVAPSGAVIEVRLLSASASHSSLPVVVPFPIFAPPLDPPSDVPLIMVTPPPVVAKEDLLANYLPGATLDRHPVPISEPDRSRLQATSGTGLPIRFRLYIDRSGNVVEVLPAAASDEDLSFIEGVKRMFLATRFIPGGKSGDDVPSYIDIEVMPRN